MKYILGIPTSQIKIKITFSIIEILTLLHICHFQINDLDKLIFVSKTWSTNLHIGCLLKHEDLASACEEKSNLTDELEVKFENGMEVEKFSKVGDMDYLP
jgi:hypothetical protein